MSEPDAHPKGRVWPGFVEVLVGFALSIALMFVAVMPALLWVAKENLLPVREHFYILAVATVAGAFIASTFVAKLLVRGRSYTPAQKAADELRHAELGGPNWFYEYLRDMTPEDRARYDAIGRWTVRAFLVSAVFAVPAGILFDRPYLWAIPPVVLALGQLWTYRHARSIGGRRAG